ncbi:hypothetical protein JCM10450v2_005936 [Rhodotorula kratochvilovae]
MKMAHPISRSCEDEQIRDVFLYNGTGGLFNRATFQVDAPCNLFNMENGLHALYDNQHGFAISLTLDGMDSVIQCLRDCDALRAWLKVYLARSASHAIELAFEIVFFRQHLIPARGRTGYPQYSHTAPDGLTDIYDILPSWKLVRTGTTNGFLTSFHHRNSRAPEDQLFPPAVIAHFYHRGSQYLRENPDGGALDPHFHALIQKAREACILIFTDPVAALGSSALEQCDGSDGLLVPSAATPTSVSDDTPAPRPVDTRAPAAAGVSSDPDEEVVGLEGDQAGREVEAINGTSLAALCRDPSIEFDYRFEIISRYLFQGPTERKSEESGDEL